nr:DUF547 domain-containing protein [Pontibacter vulgaris]
MVLACQAQPAANQLKANHILWTQLLQKHVEPNGNVSYKGFIQDKAKLDMYLAQLSKGIPDEKTWSTEEQLAYWINAYNAFTVKLIVDNYPVKSIKDLNGKLAVPLINTVWDKKFFKLGGVAYSLNNIEHDILRRKFKEPRIHFAINCASRSCPVLRREAYTAAKLELQLTEQTRLFLNDPTKNRITPEKPKLSSIFNWFSSDFTKNGSLVSFINQYAKVKIKPGAEITYLDYDWSLNE